MKTKYFVSLFAVGMFTNIVLGGCGEKEKTVEVPPTAATPAVKAVANSTTTPQGQPVNEHSKPPDVPNPADVARQAQGQAPK